MDKLPVRDIKAVEKGKLMAESMRIQACSVRDSGAVHFFSAIVAASMKKRVSYHLKVRISSNGDVLNASCECPSGKGPVGSCKHIALVCIMLASYVKHGTILIEKSCTEKLQTFHRPTKTYRGRAEMQPENLCKNVCFHT